MKQLFKIVTNSNHKDFCEELMKITEAGWCVFGNLQTCSDSSGVVYSILLQKVVTT